ncbi:hypothetical protein GEMRC1_011445 [Eukaryota sp. GEM-RC1]
MSTFGFHDVSREPGTRVWRIDNFDVVDVDSTEYGQFYTGDCYIVLFNHSNRKERHLFYWQGEESTQDERGASALKTVELDDILGGDAVQHREVQQHESSLFLSLWTDGIEYLDGEMSVSAFNKIERDVYEPRLLHLKGKRRIRCKQVPLKTSSLNCGDVFVLDLGLTLFQWNGKESSRLERAKGLDVTCKIKDQERGSRPEVILLDEGQNDDESDAEPFWAALEGDRSEILSAEEGGCDEEAEQAQDDKLYLVSDASGELKCEQVEMCEKGLTKDLLNGDDCYILDTGNELFVWVGKGSTSEEKMGAMTYAEKYLVDHGRPVWTPITRVIQDGETPLFKDHFKQWGKPVIRNVDFSRNNLQKLMGQGEKIQLDDIDIESVMTKKRQEQEQQILKMDEGSKKIEVWRIQNLRKVPVPEEDHGKFYSGDSYLVLLSFTLKNRLTEFIYYYQGRNSSRDETTASAFLAVSLDDERSGTATQVRVCQNKEPAHFINIWDGKMIVRLGDWDTPEEEREPVALYHVRGTTEFDTRAVQVPTTSKNLNSGDSFVVDDTVNGKVFVWMGSGCNDSEQDIALKVADVFAEGKQKIVIKEEEEPGEFWDCLGGKEEYASGKDLELQGDFEPRLFHCSDALGAWRIEEVHNFSQDDLLSDDAYVMDTFHTVFVWVGSGANENEAKKSFESAQKYIECVDDGRDPGTPIITVEQGKEPSLFTCHFIGWQEKTLEEFEDPYEARKAKMREEAKSKRPEFAKLADRKTSEFVDPLKKSSSSVANSNTPEFAELAQKKKAVFVDPLKKKQADGNVETTNDEPSSSSTTLSPEEEHQQKLDSIPAKIKSKLLDLPLGFDRTQLEVYLSDEAFEKEFGIKRVDFDNLPKWKQVRKEKKLGFSKVIVFDVYLN